VVIWAEDDRLGRVCVYMWYVKECKVKVVYVW
jgi:hypothetical protein